MIEFDEEKSDQQIDELKKREEEQVAQMLSTRYGVQYINLLSIPINANALRLIPEQEARENKLAAFDMVGKKIKVAVISPNNDKTLASIKNLENGGYLVTLYMTSSMSLEKAFKEYQSLSYAMKSTAGAFEVSSDEVAKLLISMKTTKDIEKGIAGILSEKKAFRISKIMEIVLAGGLGVGASDIHIEPEETQVRLRYRLDGVLVEIINIDNETYNLLLSRLKLLSGMKLNIKNEAQDGRFSVKINDSDIEMRVSILPGPYGESVVMRILNPKSISVPVEDLGIPKKLLDTLMKEIGKPQGMILTTGPTGSGKTTTLYAFLRKIYDPSIKIITIEDPIEYHLPGIVQTQTDSEKNYTFAAGLRAALRQDPDIIMVGEIRDAETAKTAVQAAQTGHLVFSTLHTNNAAGTFPRLIDLGINPKTLCSAMNIAMAQRLARKLCPFCKKEALIDGDNRKTVDEIYNSIPAEEKLNIQKEKMWLPVGCDKCNNTGYKGRIGLYEAILSDNAIEQVIINNPSEREIKKASLPQGILDMKQDGVLLLLQGITSIEELRRVIDLDNDI